VEKIKARCISNKKQKGVRILCTNLSPTFQERCIEHGKRSREWKAHNRERNKDISKSFLALRK